MDRILKILKKENAPSSAPALELNTIIFKHVYGYMQQISGERLQDHWSSGLEYEQRSLLKLQKLASQPSFSAVDNKTACQLVNAMLNCTLHCMHNIYMQKLALVF